MGLLSKTSHDKTAFCVVTCSLRLSHIAIEKIKLFIVLKLSKDRASDLIFPFRNKFSDYLNRHPRAASSSLCLKAARRLMLFKVHLIKT